MNSQIPKDRPQIGTPVRFFSYLERVKEKNGRELVTWRAKSCETRDGIYAGYRFKNEGRTRYYSGEAPEWETERRIPCAVVVVSENKAPIPVPFDAIECI